MSITLVAVLCHFISPSVPVCIEQVIPTDQMVAGKVDDPIPMPFTENYCKRLSLPDITDWLRQREMNGYWVQSWQCVPGKYEIKHRA